MHCSAYKYFSLSIRISLEMSLHLLWIPFSLTAFLQSSKEKFFHLCGSKWRFFPRFLLKCLFFFFTFKLFCGGNIFQPKACLLFIMVVYEVEFIALILLECNCFFIFFIAFNIESFFISLISRLCFPNFSFVLCLLLILDVKWFLIFAIIYLWGDWPGLTFGKPLHVIMHLANLLGPGFALNWSCSVDIW